MVKKLLKHAAGIILIIGLAALALGSTETTPAVVTPPRGTIFEGNGHGYEVIDQSLTWEEAQAAATRNGGHLAIITSASLNTFIQQLVVRDGTKNAYWVGGQLEGSQWKWVSGANVTYTNWVQGRPMSTPQPKMVILREHRSSLSSSQPGQWVDLNNTGYASDGTTLIGFVVEYRIDRRTYNVSAPPPPPPSPWVTNLPQNTDVVFQTTRVASNARNGIWSAQNTNNGSDIHLWDFTGQAHSIFRLHHLEDGWYRISNGLNHGRSVDIRGGRDDNGVAMQIYDRNDSVSQRFRIRRVSEGEFEFHTVHERTLNLSGSNTNNGNRIHTWRSATDDPNNKFRILQVGNNANLTPVR